MVRYTGIIAFSSDPIMAQSTEMPRIKSRIPKPPQGAEMPPGVSDQRTEMDGSISQQEIPARRTVRARQRLGLVL